MKVSDILDRKGWSTFTVDPDARVAVAVAMFCRRNVGAAPVIDRSGDLVGIITERDVIAALAFMQGAALDEPVGRIMARPVLTCAPSDPLRSVIRTMTDRRVRHLPVVEGERLVGIVSIGDVLKPRLEESELEMGVLRDMARARIA